MEFRLAPRTHASNGLVVRLSEDARKSVVYLGLRTVDKAGASKVIYGGTAFFVSHEDWSYLITARHVAEALHGPFVVGHNLANGTLCESDIDQADWVYHDNPNVDIAAVPVGLTDADWAPIWSGYFAYQGPDDGNFGVGDFVYIVGLYRFVPGKAKITPVVHTGHIAMMPHEDIPMRNRTTTKIMMVRGYLVEAQTLEGLSGSPVFVRYTNLTAMHSGKGRVAAYTADAYLLGLWAGAWDAPAGELLAEQLGREARVPVGMGITIPVERIVDVLNSKKLREQREEAKARLNTANAASMDSALPEKSAQPATADNPSHKEAFNSLVDAAAKKRPPTD